jgi:pre-mRNA-splicing factor SYF1
LEPDHVEEYINYLKHNENWDEAAYKITEILENTDFKSFEGKTNYQLWLELCDIITKHPKQIKNINVENIIRHGIRLFTDELSRLWTSLADFYVRKGMFERTRDVYEDAIAATITIKDFSIIFEAYSQFEESVLSARIDAIRNQSKSTSTEEAEIDLRFARLEALIERRPELISSVVLRQNPHNVSEWHKRAHIYSKEPTKQIATYYEAINSIDPIKAIGKPHTLWCAFAKLYERNHEIDNARIVFKKAVTQLHLWPTDLSGVYCDWVEMELRNRNFKNGLAILHTILGVTNYDKNFQAKKKRT